MACARAARALECRLNVALRETWQGRVWRVVACRIVEERDDLLVLWHPQGTAVKRPFGSAGRELRIPGDWYVNFETAFVRTEVGFDHVDEKLDLVIDPYGAWRWKDEDELEEAARLGLVDAGEVRAEAARVLADPPWPTGWEDWRPDPEWPTPRLPEGWDVV